MNRARHVRTEEDRELPFVVLTPTLPRRAASSAVLGGGIGTRHWVLNATVPHGYSRSDPRAHLAQLAQQASLQGPGVGMMTAVSVDHLVATTDGGVAVWATTGVDEPLWAAAPAPEWHAKPQPVGTINVVVELPVRLSDAALVNAVMTATEAKSQALYEAQLAGTGTATDAVCVLCPTDGAAEPYGGPRSLWGSRVARAAHAAIAQGLANIADTARTQ